VNIGKQNFHFIALTFLTEGLIPDCDDDVMDEVPLLSWCLSNQHIPTHFSRHLTAKMELLLLVAFARIRQAPSRTRG
jgi:hypothetical protein